MYFPIELPVGTLKNANVLHLFLGGLVSSKEESSGEVIRH